jgi:tRNA (guanine37-N1)-methyltransferase
MITFHIICLFPDQVENAVKHSVMYKAVSTGKIKLAFYDLKEFGLGKHRSVDSSPYGGGAGMVLRVDVLHKALLAAKEAAGSQAPVILMDARGKQFSQAKAKKWSKLTDIIFVAGHYEGVDERFLKYVDEQISIGPYVLTGGELPIAVIIDAVSRLKEGVLGNEESLESESHNIKGYLDYAQYTRPEEYDGMKVPDVLLSGHHAEIEKWRKTKS